MSILIKGMEMPKCCSECQMFDRYMYGCKLCSFGIPSRYGYDAETKPYWCPLIEVPEHGRLIDADILVKKFCSHCDDYMSGKDECKEGCFDLKIIKSMPTVIPADKEEVKD